MKVWLVEPRGFCAGVDRAIQVLDRVIALYGAPVYCYHSIVHNEYVIQSFEAKGVVFVHDLNDVPSGSHLVFSAHGVSPAIKEQAYALGLLVFDATCPLVTKTHKGMQKASEQGMDCVLIGNKNHPEIKGTQGYFKSQGSNQLFQIEDDSDILSISLKKDVPIYCVTQTTLDSQETAKVIARLKNQFPLLKTSIKSDICYATTNRQNALRQILPYVDLVLVIGSYQSSNTKHLLELALDSGKIAYLIESVDKLQNDWLKGIDKIAITAGASAPEILVTNVLKKLTLDNPNLTIEHADYMQETTTFALPKELNNS